MRCGGSGTCEVEPLILCTQLLTGSHRKRTGAARSRPPVLKR